MASADLHRRPYFEEEAMEGSSLMSFAIAYNGNAMHQ